ncbi:MAG TPA: NADH-quinone oxidoreductase subunit C [Streptosporangiaceae bacterium]|nr:NADH-quinone oxidoreductase subunit C [Streptosporangiaceae bacterium]
MTEEEIVGRVQAGLGRAGGNQPLGAESAGEARWSSAGVCTDAVECEVSQATVTVTVPAAGWLAALAFARDELGCDFFDWLTAVDELDDGLAVVAHLYSLTGRHHLLLRTMLGGREPRLPTATGSYRGAAWHEREACEMFGVVFEGHPRLDPLLLPEGFEGHPLRKDFVLAARAAQEWPGAKEPGEREGVARGRRRSPQPGVPEGWAR